MAQAYQNNSWRRETGAPLAPRGTPPAWALPRRRLLLKMGAQWKLRAHRGYLQAASFRWPRPARADQR
jgi:hypothetical protein